MSDFQFTWKFVFSVLITVLIQAVAIHSKIFELMPVWLEFIVLVGLACMQLFISHLLDFRGMRNSIRELGSTVKRLTGESRRSKEELAELRTVIVSFLEHSEIYRDRVRDFLKLNEDYVCIVKSAEGFSDIWEELPDDQKRPLPFTTALANLPGAIRPFENIGLFLIPTANLQGIHKVPLRTFIDRHIIPIVNTERKKFLRALPPNLRAKADQLSYKYIAFFLRKDAIAHDITENRKFNREFNVFIVDEQIGYGLDKMKAELIDVVRARDVLRLVNWASFAELNDDRREFIQQNKAAINEGLSANGINSLSDLATIAPQELSRIMWRSLSKRQKADTTERKLLNLSVTVVSGARLTVDVLRRNGVQL